MTSGTGPRRERRIPQSVVGQSADHTSARERWEDYSGRSREPSSAARRKVQTFEAEAQRRGVPGNAQEWQHTRHGGVHDHAEKCNDEPEQPSSGRNSLYTRRAQRGETVGLGSPRPRVAREGACGDEHVVQHVYRRGYPRDRQHTAKSV